MEKRLRLRKNQDVPDGYATINQNIADLLQVEEGKILEVVISKKRFQFKLKIDKKLEGGVHLSDREMTKNGLMDNTIATVREAIS